MLFRQAAKAPAGARLGVWLAQYLDVIAVRSRDAFLFAQGWPKTFTQSGASLALRRHRRPGLAGSRSASLQPRARVPAPRAAEESRGAAPPRLRATQLVAKLGSGTDSSESQ